jgi:hypothetical protein
MFIPDPDFSPHPGSMGQKAPIRIRNTAEINRVLFGTCKLFVRPPPRLPIIMNLFLKKKLGENLGKESGGISDPQHLWKRS